MRVPRKIKKGIPRGMYCYTYTGKTFQHWNEEHKTYVTAFKVKPCPYWIYKNDYEYGDCKYLQKLTGKQNGEDDNVDFVLDDQCKSCDIKTDYGK